MTFYLVYLGESCSRLLRALDFLLAPMTFILALNAQKSVGFLVQKHSLVLAPAFSGFCPKVRKEVGDARWTENPPDSQRREPRGDRAVTR